MTIGGTIGHAICTGIAVLGGRIVAQRISVRTGRFRFGPIRFASSHLSFFSVTLIGGVVFIVFALSALVMNPDAS